MSDKKRPPISREEFERGYAERSGMTVESLRELLREWGWESAPCNCDDPSCFGWQMTTANARKFADEMARLALITKV